MNRREFLKSILYGDRSCDFWHSPNFHGGGGEPRIYPIERSP